MIDSRAIAGALVLALAFAPRAHGQAISAGEAEALRAEVATLRARLELLERKLNAPQIAAVAPQPSAPASPMIEWKGAPRFVDGDRAFKAKGRIQADTSYISHPGGIEDRGLGFSNEFRRIRLGGEGKLGAGFGYKLEIELSDNSVDLVDTFVTYQRGSWFVTLGNQNPLQSLDELTGDTSGSFMERAAFTDAFNFERRLGLSVQYRRGPILAQAGVFTDDIGALANESDGPEGGDENNSYSFDGRMVFAPSFGEKGDSVQLHFGASAHLRRLKRVAEAPIRYRQRPFIHSTNTRLIGTPELSVREETSHGLEFAAIHGRWHAAAETHWLRAARIGAPTVRFRGGYAEIGYFLTEGDSRTYDKGTFGTPTVHHPFGKNGGIGSVQVNLRYDYLDLNSRDVRGGIQNGYFAALIWAPIQYLRFNLNYGYLDYAGARALSDGRTGYGAHVFGSRFELDF